MLTDVIFFFSSRRRHTRYIGDWSSDVCSSDLGRGGRAAGGVGDGHRVVAGGRRRDGLRGGAGGPEIRRGAGRRQRDQIGRASCRERVEISGDGEIIEKEKLKCRGEEVVKRMKK